MQQFTEVTFIRFKAFKNFRLHLRHFNILVGPNNAGKSTILAAFRILAAGLRKARSRRPSLIHGPNGSTLGYQIGLEGLSVAEENIFHNYDDDYAALVEFSLSDGKKLTLYFPEKETAYLIADAGGQKIDSPASFKANFDCPIGFVPILGPVEHNEKLFEPEAASRALFTYQAARNFRNIWYHFPNYFDEFRDALRRTWPGMDIDNPEIDYSYDRALLRMYCPEERIPRELFWAGFGFQVWCQMLTHVIQNKTATIFLIDEPDIYLHADLQRQLLSILRELGPDILVATHSTEIISEADAHDIVIINKKSTNSKRLKNTTQLAEVFSILGSNLNPVLTQLGKTRRVVFVEGKDFQVISRFASKLDYPSIANRSDFAVVPLEGFNPERMKNLKAGMEATLGVNVRAAIVLDRDYRSDLQCEEYKIDCSRHCDVTTIHNRKEIENFLLVPAAVDRAVRRRLAERERRTGHAQEYTHAASDILKSFCDGQKAYTMAQFLTEYKRFSRLTDKRTHEAALNQTAMEVFDRLLLKSENRLMMIGGKEALSYLSTLYQDEYSISLTATGVVDAMQVGEIPLEMIELVKALDQFSKMAP